MAVPLVYLYRTIVFMYYSYVTRGIGALHLTTAESAPLIDNGLGECNKNNEEKDKEHDGIH